MIDLSVHEMGFRLQRMPDGAWNTSELAKFSYSWVGTAGFLNKKPLTSFLESYRGFIDTFLSFEASVVRIFPTLFFAGTMYAFHMLNMLSLSAPHPESQLGKAIQPENTRLSFYLKQTTTILRAIGGGTRAAYPEGFRSFYGTA